MRGKRASGTKHERKNTGLQNIKFSFTYENFHSKFRGLLLCSQVLHLLVFLRFLIPKHWRNASLHPHFVFVWLTHYSLGRG